jgi:CubicO group peptidase (beta-lactamase class C family)
MGAGGFSAPRLRRLEATMAGHVARGSTPGVAWVVSRRGEAHAGALGTTTRDGSEPVRRDTIFRISSMTKPVTAVAAMILVEECVLRLDDPVDEWLPELADRRVLRSISGPLHDTVPARRPITLRDLLTFRMGFGQAFPPEGESYPIVDAAVEAQLGMGPPAPATTPAPDEWMKRLGALPLMYQPGERWVYNTPAEVLGVLIARASGQPFDAFLAERVLAPLGMADTGFSVPQAKLSRFTPSYWTDFRTGQIVEYDPVDGAWARPPAFPGGGAGLVSTVDDYLAFAAMLLNFGRYQGGRLLSRPSVELMTTDHLTPEQKRVSGFSPPEDFAAIGWGFGMEVATRRDGPWHLGRYGWSGGLGSIWHNDPAEQLVTILLSQQAWAGPIAPALVRDLWTGAYAAIDD